MKWRQAAVSNGIQAKHASSDNSQLQIQDGSDTKDGWKKGKKNYRKRRKGLLSLLYILICMFFILDEARFLRENY